jgi:hypothetical protein
MDSIPTCYARIYLVFTQNRSRVVRPAHFYLIIYFRNSLQKLPFLLEIERLANAIQHYQIEDQLRS